MPPPNLQQMAAELKRLRKQVDGESSSESASSDETSSDDDFKDAKMEPPKTEFSGGGDKEKGYREWRSVRPVHSKWFEIRESIAKSEVLAGLYLDAIKEPARGKMLRELTRIGKRATVKRYMKILDVIYMEDAAISLDQWDKKLAGFSRRPSQTLTQFLEFWDDQLLLAEQVGYEKSKTEPFRLIRACDLEVESRDALMLELQRCGHATDPPYKKVRKLLGEIGRSKRQFEERGERKQRKQKGGDGGQQSQGGSTHAAFVAGVSFAKGKGKGKRNKSPQIQRTIDKGFNSWKKTGTPGKFSGGQQGGGGGSQLPKKQVPCRFFQAGTCTKGNACEWKHGGGGGKGNTGGTAKNFEKKPGDWTCTKCNVNNFASRETCFKACGSKRPT